MAAKKPATKTAIKPDPAKPAMPGGKPNGKAGAAKLKATASVAKVRAGPPPARIAKLGAEKAPVGTGGGTPKQDAKKPAKNESAATKPPAEKASKPEKTPKVEKAAKAKLVRDSFTMPVSEYDLLAQVKKRCIASGAAVKKSEVLRAAITSFAALGDEAIGKAIAALQPVKTGRPRKD